MRWIVRPGDGTTVGEVLRRAGADAGALPDGRVFVGRRRARDASDAVKEGDEVTVAAPTAAPAAKVTILAQTSDLVIADKPAGMPTIPDQRGAAHALLAVVARELGVAPSRLHPTSRLDRDVSGAVTFALDARAAARLKEARAAGVYERRYVAVAVRAPSPPAGAWDAPIGRGKDPRLRAAFGKDAASARSLYRVVAEARAVAMLALAPVTGRTHQLRVHAAHAGAPLVGDASYGGPARITLPSGKVVAVGRVALHCARVVVPAEGGAAVRAESPVPAALRDLWLSLGGEAAAWDIAVSCTVGEPPSS